MIAREWVVHTEDGTHTIHLEISFTNQMKVTWDNEAVGSKRVFLFFGNLMSFQRSGHLFVLSAQGSLKYDLTMDGVKLLRSDVGVSVKPTPASAALQFIKDLRAEDSEEILGIEEYPLDNRFGDQAFTTVRQVSRESTNELSIDTSGKLGGKLGLDVLSTIKAEIEAEMSQKTGCKIGEKVTESQTLTFSVGPKSSVLYEVVWKRKVRCGERLYMLGDNTVTIPYRIDYGLSCDVRTRPQTGG